MNFFSAAAIATVIPEGGGKKKWKRPNKYDYHIGHRCTVPECNNRRGIDNANGIKRGYYSYPIKDALRLKLWLDAIQRENWMPSEHSKICSDHFVGGNLI